MGISETKPPKRRAATDSSRPEGGAACDRVRTGKDVYEPSWPMTVLGLGCVKRDGVEN